MTQALPTHSTDTLIRNELLSFISQFPSLSQEEVGMIAANITVKLFPKGSILIREGDICNECYFVLKGCLRQYVLMEGLEKTTQFYTEKEAAVFFTSQTKKQGADSFLICLEDTIAIVGNPAQETEMYQQFPKLSAITRKMMEQDLGKMQDTLSHFITSSPEERYKNILENRPHLLKRVPQHQLASYIGVTPESLSRIRKRLTAAK